MAAVPEPGTFVLLAAGLVGLALLRKKGRVGVLLAMLAGALSIGAKTQNTGQDPDYTNVGDILNGRRTLLSIDDLVVAGTNITGPYRGNQNTFTLTTTNSQLTAGSTTSAGADLAPIC